MKKQKAIKVTTRIALAPLPAWPQYLAVGHDGQKWYNGDLCVSQLAARDSFRRMNYFDANYVLEIKTPDFQKATGEELE